MNLEMTQNQRFARQPLAALGKLSAIALVGMAGVVLLSGLILTGTIDMFALIIAGIVLILAVLTATGWRWATIVTAVLSSLLLLAMGAFTVPAFAHPHEPDFPVIVLFLALGLVAATAGIGAAVQNVRGGERHAPRWLSQALFGLGGLVLGAILVSSIPAQGAAAGISSDMLQGLSTVKTEAFAFDQEEIRVKAGESVALKLINEDTTAHTFDIDELDVHAPMPSSQTGLALFQPTEPGQYTFYCAIPGHANLEEGTGMMGTLIVEPAD